MTARATFQGGARARKLFNQGKSCNAIARELGVAPSTISRWAKAEGLSFAREQTALAVRARVLDIAEANTLLVQKMLTVAHDALDKLDGPFLVYNFGGKDNTYEEHTLSEAPIDARRSAQVIAKTAHDAAVKQLEHTPAGVAEAESLIDRLEADLAAEFAEDGDDGEPVA